MKREALGDGVEKAIVKGLRGCGGEVLAGGEENGGQSDDVLEEVGEFAARSVVAED